MSIIPENLEQAVAVEDARVSHVKPGELDASETPLPISDNEYPEVIEAVKDYLEETSTSDKKAEAFETRQVVLDTPSDAAKKTKNGKRSREDYELDSQVTADESEEEDRLAPLPIPKRSPSSKMVIQSLDAEASEESPEQFTGSNTNDYTEETPIPSSSSDASSSPSTTINEESEPTPKIVEISSDSDFLPRHVSKRRRITDTFKGLFNVFGESVTSALSFALER